MPIKAGACCRSDYSSNDNTEKNQIMLNVIFLAGDVGFFAVAIAFGCDRL
jgi:hypothetical protein